MFETHFLTYIRIVRVGEDLRSATHPYRARASPRIPVAGRVPCEEGGMESSVGTIFADGRFVNQQCKNHCRGPHRPHVHSGRSICREKDVPMLPGLQPITEDPGTYDIVKATQ